VLAGLALGAACAVVVSCGGAKQMASPASVLAAPSAASTEGPRQEIERLDREIDQQLGGLGLSSPPPACAATAACPGPTAEQMGAGLAPPTTDATCTPAPSEQCQTSCQLADSICSNAKRICVLADELGGDDAYANEKCARGNTSCDKSREKCCGCL
jgi:hypothetical protein